MGCIIGSCCKHLEGEKSMAQTKIDVSVSLVPGKKYFLKYTSLKEVLTEIKMASENVEVWVDIEGKPLIPIQGEDKVICLKTYISNLLQRYEISSLVQSDEEILKTINES